MGWWFWGGVIAAWGVSAAVGILTGFSWTAGIQNAAAGLTGGKGILANHATRHAYRMRYG